MYIFPAIDLYQGQAVRLYQGDYAQMTVYSRDLPALAENFFAQGARHLHLVHLEGARDGGTPNLSSIEQLARSTPLFTEVGGGIRTMDTISRYLDAGVDRVILGTAAVTHPELVEQAVTRYGKQIAVGVDIRGGKVAIHGWTEDSPLEALAFCKRMEDLGIQTMICTDISKDGAMQGSNHGLYRTLQQELKADLVASGGVSSLEDVKALAKLGLYGAIIGKAYYTGAVSLAEAVEAAK